MNQESSISQLKEEISVLGKLQAERSSFKVGARLPIEEGRVSSKSSLISRRLAPPLEPKFPKSQAVCQDEESVVPEEAGREITTTEIMEDSATMGIMGPLKKSGFIHYDNSDEEEEPLTPRGPRSRHSSFLLESRGNGGVMVREVHIMENTHNSDANA